MLKPSLQLRLSQQLTMTPQLQQAIRLLQLPIMELQTQIQEALDENVMLEIDEPETTASSDTVEDSESDADAREAGEETDAPVDLNEVTVAADSDWTDTQTTGPSDTPTSYEPRGTLEYEDRSEETLLDHLFWQLELENLDARTTAIGQAIIDAINEDGYLMDDSETIQETLSPDIVASGEEVETIIKLVQRLDPAGVGSRSVSDARADSGCSQHR